jgi:ABC-type transport system involved in multi-copper enzyme maturation permease subunit
MPPRLLLRLHRVGAIAMTYFAIFYVLFNSAVYPLIAGKTRAAQEAFGVEISSLGAQFAWLLPLPIRPDTAAGYLQWRGYGVFAIVFGAWGLLSACGAVRRDEDRGLVEAWLSTGMSRSKLLLTRTAAFAVLSAAVVVIAGFAGWLGCMIAGSPAQVAGLVGESAALWGLTMSCFGIGALVAQIAPDFRAAAGYGATVLIVLFVIDSIGRSSINRSPLTDVSVFFLFNRSNAFAPGGSFDPVATIALVLVGAITTAIATVAFTRRDLDSGLIRRRSQHQAPIHEAARNPLLRVPVLRGLWTRRVGSLLWVVGVAAGAAAVVDIIDLTANFFANTPSLAPYLRHLPGDVHIVLLALIWFSVAQGVLAILAITYVARWAADDSSGVLELQLGEPVPRWGVLAERAGELLLLLVVIAFAAAAVILALAPAQGLHIDVARMLVATALLVPFGLTFAALGALLAGWRPRAAVVVLSTVTAVSYLVFQLGPVLKWPAWADNLSVFQLYGTPLLTSVFAGGLIAMLCIVMVGFATAGIALARRDIGT